MNEEMIQKQFDAVTKAIANLALQVSSFKKDVDEDLRLIKDTVHRTAVHVANLEGSVSDLKREMATKRDLVQRDIRLSAFMAEVKNAQKLRMWIDMSYKRHEARFDKIERRLARIEVRAS